MNRRGLAGLVVLGAVSACGSRSPTDHDRVLYVRHEGADLMTWVRGNVGSGTLMVLIHGGPGGESTTYAEDLHPLEAEIGIAYMDQRASGASRGTFSPERYSYAQFGRDLGAVVEALHAEYAPERLVLMGHSFGVEVGTEYLVTGDNQTRVDGWIPVNGTFSVTAHAQAQCAYIIDRVDDLEARRDLYASLDVEITDEDLTAWQGWREECRSSVIGIPVERDVLDTGWDRALTLPARPVEEQPYDRFFPDWWTSPYSARAALANEAMVYWPMDEAYIRFERGDDLARLTLPVAAMWGQWDPIIPLPVGEQYVDLVGTPPEDVSLTVFPNAYHSPMVESQDAFLDAVRGFLDGL